MIVKDDCNCATSQFILRQGDERIGSMTAQALSHALVQVPTDTTASTSSQKERKFHIDFLQWLKKQFYTFMDMSLAGVEPAASRIVGICENHGTSRTTT